MEKKKIGYGLVGLGNIGLLHLMVLKNLPLWNILPEREISLVGLYSTQPEKNINQAIKIGFPRIVPTLYQFLDLSGLDIVDICTPNFLHHEQVLASAAKGKHIYCEKPLGLNKKEALEMQKAVEKNNLHHQIPFVLRFLPAVAKTRALLNSEAIGKVYYIRAELLHSGYLNPSRPFAWRLEKKSSGGGAIADLGSHLLDLILFLFGKITTVQAQTRTIITQRKDSEGKIRGVDVDDWAEMSFQLEEDILASLEVSRLAVGKEGLRFSIYGDKGALHLSDNSPLSPSLYNPKGQKVEPEDFPRDAYLDLLQDCYPPSKLSTGWMGDAHAASLIWFLRCIVKNQKRPETPDFSSGLAVQEVLDLAYQSAAEEGKLFFL